MKTKDEICSAVYGLKEHSIHSSIKLRDSLNLPPKQNLAIGAFILELADQWQVLCLELAEIPADEWCAHLDKLEAEESGVHLTQESILRDRKRRMEAIRERFDKLLDS